MAPLLLVLFVCQTAGEADSQQRGLTLAAGGQLEAAAAAFSKACERSPKQDDACYYSARTLFTLGRYVEARDAFEKALRLASKPILARVHRGAALNFIALTSPDEAERHFLEAVRLTRSTPQSGEDPRIDYAAFLFRQGRAADALPLLEEAVASQPDSARALTELGRVLLHTGKKEMAAARLEKAVELDPGSTTARLLLGRTYLELDRKEEGEKQLRLGQESWKRRYGSSTVK
jgi:tetratricopeptide (TPR) repeat protein